MKYILATGVAMAIAGCAQVEPETRVAGVPIPCSWIERAEGDDPRACAAVSVRLRESDAMESLRFLRKGADLRDGECCRRYLDFIEGSGVNLSQRLYGRLFLESLLQKGPIRTAAGEDLTLDLYHQLCWAWRCTEPRNTAKARRAVEAMMGLGLTPELARSRFIREIIEKGVSPRRGNEISTLVDGGADDDPAWVPTARVAPQASVERWNMLDATAWGGGSDKLLCATGVLAFLVNDHGEPSFRGRHLWIRNCGTIPVYYSAPATGAANLELAPGQEELRPVERQSLDEHRLTTGIPLTVRFRS